MNVLVASVRACLRTCGCTGVRVCGCVGVWVCWCRARCKSDLRAHPLSAAAAMWPKSSDRSTPHAAAVSAASASSLPTKRSSRWFIETDASALTDTHTETNARARAQIHLHMHMHTKRRTFESTQTCRANSLRSAQTLPAFPRGQRLGYFDIGTDERGSTGSSLASGRRPEPRTG